MSITLVERLRVFPDNVLEGAGLCEEAADYIAAQLRTIELLGNDLDSARAEIERLTVIVSAANGRDDRMAEGFTEQFLRQGEVKDSAIQCLREIAAMGRKAGSEAAQHWLLQHGYPLEDGGYVPGRGFLGEP